MHSYYKSAVYACTHASLAWHCASSHDARAGPSHTSLRTYFSCTDATLVALALMSILSNKSYCWKHCFTTASWAGPSLLQQWLKKLSSFW